MKKIVISLVITLLPILGVLTFYLNSRLTEAEERASYWSNMYKESSTCSGGENDAWFEKNAMTRTGQPDDLLKLADDLGLKHIRKTNIVYVDSLSLEGAAGIYANGTHGDSQSRRIEILKKWSDQEKRVILAHEYLHYIWNNSAAMQNDDKLERGLLRMYATSPYLKNRLSSYVDNDLLRLTEMFSYACTEMQDRNIDDYVLSWCNKWLDRSKLELKN